MRRMCMDADGLSSVASIVTQQQWPKQNLDRDKDVVNYSRHIPN